MWSVVYFGVMNRLPFNLYCSAGQNFMIFVVVEDVCNMFLFDVLLTARKIVAQS